MKTLTIPITGTVVWRDKSGQIVMRSRDPEKAALRAEVLAEVAAMDKPKGSPSARKPKAKKLSAAQLKLIVAALLGEAFAVEDPALRGRLLTSAGQMDMRRLAAESHEATDPRQQSASSEKLTPAAVDRLVADALRAAAL